MDWINAILQGVLLGGLYALFAAGLSLIFGVMRLVNIAHGDIIVVSAYLAFFISQGLGINPFLGLLIVIPLAALLGYALQRFLLNYALGEDLPPLLITFGLSVIIQNVLLIVFTPDSRRLGAGPIEIASWEPLPGLYVGALPLLQLVTAIVLVGGLQILFYKTPLGRAFRATSDDPEVAQLMGLDNRRLFSIAMALAVAVAAVAGTFIAIRTNFDPFSGPRLLVFGFESIIIGGMGNLWGTLAGGIILGVAQSVGGHINVAWPVLAGHVAFLLLLLVRKNGLFPATAQ
jgi:branched-chain amino acid transport system permease protein